MNESRTALHALCDLTKNYGAFFNGKNFLKLPDVWQMCRYGSTFTIASLFCLKSFLGPSMPFLVKSELAISLKMAKITFDHFFFYLKNISRENHLWVPIMTPDLNQSNLVIRNFLVTLKLFLNAKSSLSLWCKLAFGHGKWCLNNNLFLIKTFLITKFDCTRLFSARSGPSV